VKAFRRRRVPRAGPLLPADVLRAAAERYRDFRPHGLSYATVRDYCDSYDHLGALATLSGDLKDVQRPWALKAVLGAVSGRVCKILEIGAGEPVVADLLQRLGHEVWIVDPYDGGGNGPTDYERYAAAYPGLRFVREQFSEATSLPNAHDFDCVYSISVLEHVATGELAGVTDGTRRCLRPDGVAIHAVDHVHRGRGSDEHLSKLKLMVEGWSLPPEALTSTLEALCGDTDTYYLSAEGHNRWRGGLPYDEFPMRVCVSIQSCTPAHLLKHV
jgi:SAM-dependent methyltransferase